MTRTETLAAINALPVSDAVKAHTTRLIEGLPDWCPMPYECAKITQDHAAVCVCRWVGNLYVVIDDNAGAPRFSYSSVKNGMVAGGTNITDRDVHELLRQLTGMVALTWGG